MDSFKTFCEEKDSRLDNAGGESDKMKAKRKSFKARHGKNIAKGKMSAAYWANKEKW